MLTKDDIESFLVRLAATGATYSEVEPGFWIVRPSAESDLSIAVNYSPPVVLLRIDVMTLPRVDVQVGETFEAFFSRHAWMRPFPRFSPLQNFLMSASHYFARVVTASA